VKKILGARSSAALVLDRVIRTGAYSNVAVARTEVDPASAHGHFQRLVYTALRYLPFIDGTIEQHAARSVNDVDPMVMSILRIAIGEVVFLDAEPHAVVNEAVRSSRILGQGRAAGFVNAVLRSTTATQPQPGDLVAASYPGGLTTMLNRDHDDQWVTDFLLASNQAPHIGVRYRDGRMADSVIPHTAYVDDDVTSQVASGTLDVMDPASAAVAVALAVRPGDTVVDLAAAPGGKTRAIADAAGDTGFVVGSDIHQRRVRDAAKRAHTPSGISWMVADAVAPALRRGVFDRVLLDAPCTGLGTMRRRPEIRFRVDRDAPASYGILQRRMLTHAMECVRPGGRLVYSVCTVTAHETTGVVAGLGFRAPSDLPGDHYGDGLLLSPHRTNTDGMFIAVWDA
jgi:16S rRNA (cytosine967-C5)-methyltransferase